MTPEEKMDYADLSWKWTIVLGVAVRDGILDAVANTPKTPSEVAARLNTDERATYTILSSLVELGILKEDDGRYRLLEEHRGPLLDDEHPGYVGGRVVHGFELVSTWSQLPDILVSGKPPVDRTTPNFDGTPTMAQAMRGGARDSADEISRKLLADLPASPTILDIGGGPGTNAESFARHGAKVTVFDRPEVLEVTAKYLTRAGVQTIAGDMNESLPDGKYDAVYFGNTSHMYDRETNRRLFSDISELLNPGGILCMKEFVRGHSEDAALFAVNMLVLTSGGGVYTYDEYEQWLTEVGFTDVEPSRLEGQTAVLILARKQR